MFGKNKRGSAPVVQTVPKTQRSAAALLLTQGETLSAAERALYDSLRESVPIIDAALDKIIRLMGGFSVKAKNRAAQAEADEFVKNVRVNGTDFGLNSFVFSFLDSLLTYGQAVGEMLPESGLRGVSAVYNAALRDVSLRPGKSPMEPQICVNDTGGPRPVSRPELVFASLLNQKPGTLRGRSLLSGLPFVSEILLRIFTSLKNNWERVGDVRFAVTYTPESGECFTEESARQIADEWRKAMRGEGVCDFVSLGKVSVRAIGAEMQMPDCEVPVRTLLEQILSKLGLPPFLLGISWSSTERMSEQQADILTSELEYYRAAVSPVIIKIVSFHLRLRGYSDSVDVLWDDINLQDTVELSQARLNNARAMQIEKEIGWEEEDA